MKKIFLLASWMVGTVTIASAQELTAVETIGQTQVMCKHIDVSHWSIGIKTGANYYNIEPEAPTRYDKLNLMIGGTVDYTINPLIGIGLEYNYNDFTRPYAGATGNNFLKGGTHDALLYGSVNLSNALSPFRTGLWKNLNIYGDLGAGLAFYHYNLDWGRVATSSTTDPNTLVGKIGINAEFTLNKSLNLGFEGQYRVYNINNLGGAIAFKNSEALIATVGLRYKFASGTKKHARNISFCEYTPKPVPVIVNTIVKGDTDETLNRLKAMEQENANLKQKMQDDAKNAVLQKSLEAQNAALKQRMLDDAKNNSLVTQNSTLQQKLQKMEDDLKNLATQKEGIVNASFETIEFKSGSSVLTSTSTQLLDQISGILKNNSYWTGLKVYGHTDSVGSSAYNQKLSESRALSVKKYMLSKGVQTSNVIAIGMGENKPIDTNNTPTGRQNNRRVEFEITK